MKVLVTGGYGFMGSSIAQKFYEEGYEIYIVDNLSKGKKENLKINHKFYNLDINDLQCEKIFKLHRFDLVIHAASISDKDLNEKDIYTNRTSNIMGLLNIIQLSVKYNIKTFVYPSSAEVYGENSLPTINETTKPKITSPLGIEKTIGENLCIKWKELYELNIIIFRIGNIYGPKQNIECDSFLLPYLMERIYYDEPIPLGKFRDNKFNLLYIDDLVNSIFNISKLSSKEQSHFFIDDKLPVVNISSKKNYSIAELLTILAPNKKLSTKKNDFNPYLNFVDMDTSTLNSIYNLNEKYSLQEGLKLTYNWYKKQKTSKKKKNNLFTTIKNFFNPHQPHIPLLVNILLFLVIFVINFISPNHFRLQITNYIDINYIYIILISVMYGNRQSLLSVIFSILIYITNFIFTGGNFYALTYTKEHIIHIAFYMILGSIIGYFINKYKREINIQKFELSNINDNYTLLDELYNESISLNKNIENQISETKISENKISDSDKSININEYIKETPILTPMAFNKILQSFEEKRTTYNIDYVLIKIDTIPERYFKNKTATINNKNRVLNYLTLYMDISLFLRPTDYVGIDKNGIIYIILYDTNKQTANIVLSRLKNKNINSHFINKDDDINGRSNIQIGKNTQ